MVFYNSKLKGGQTMENGTESRVTLAESLKARAELFGYLTGIIFGRLTDAQVDYWNSHKSQLKKKANELFSISDEFGDLRDDWQKFYKIQFGWNVEFSTVVIPQKPTTGNYRLLFIAKGLTLNRVFDAWKFPKWRYNDDLDKAVPTNKRTAAESYAIWVLAGDKPDAEFLGKSTNQADPSMEIGVTLLERMVFESKYFAETGKHLDVKGVTFCSGSRRSDGSVLRVYLYTSGEVCVNWYDLDDSDAEGGVRRAVTL